MVSSRAPKPPFAKKIPVRTLVHGVELVDDYAWLRGGGNQGDDPEVIAHLEAENAYTEAVMADTKELQETIYNEILGRIQETDLSVPVRIGDYFYYSRQEEGKQYSIHCRRRKTMNSPEEILLDGNQVAGDSEYMSLGNLAVSPDHRLLAWAVDLDGSETYTVRIRDLATGEDRDDRMENTAGDLEWAADNETLFYTVLDKSHRPFKVFRHKLGGPPEEDALVHHEEDERFYLGLGRTKDRRYLLIEAGSAVTSEVRFLPSDDPEGTFRLFAPRCRDVEYSLYHHEGWFYILTNEDAPNFRLFRTRVDTFDRTAWEEIVPHSGKVKLDRLSMFRNHMVIAGRRNGLTSLQVHDLTTGRTENLEFDEPIYTCGIGENPEYDTDTVRYLYTSYLTPRSVFDYDMKTGARVLRKETPVLGGYDRSLYTQERRTAEAPDGPGRVQVPLSLVYRKDLPRDEPHPTVLYGYGSYGISRDPVFSHALISLLDRGVVFAVGHPRGGGENGRLWYEEGKYLKKPNTFTDFLACAESLIRDGVTAPDRLAIQGGSAGGLLVGAVLNLRPELFHAAIAQVPFVDVVNTMLDKELPLTMIEYDEWGNPEEKEFFDCMLSYAPYENVRAKPYPHLLATAGLTDPRVGFWEPAKWVAKLREFSTSDRMLLLKTRMGAGHGGASGRYDAIREVAFNYAFLLKAFSTR